jgi:phosphate transport system substrate-binding protein
MLFRNFLFRFASLLVVVLPMSATWAEDLTVPGSGNPEHVLKVLADVFNRQQSAHRIIVPTSSGTSGALRDVESGTATLGRVGRPLKAAELARGLVYIPIGRDPVTFVAGAGVTAKNLTSEQALAVYAGQLRNWKALGGKPGPIRAIGRESTDASRAALNKTIAAFGTLAFSDRVKMVNLDPQMVALLDRFPTSLGFINRSALAACTTQVKALALDGVESTPSNVGAGRYPMWLEMGFVHKAGEPGAAATAFIEFVQSSQGVRILREQGVLASPRPS